ncbi:hypothetical protein KCP74_12540 [Salmonella enterica subsp. enterica]|nr:hypothetical protein KCP74_12540 [Salmonella enterica subsp. enterica]
MFFQVGEGASWKYAFRQAVRGQNRYGRRLTLSGDNSYSAAPPLSAVR